MGWDQKLIFKFIFMKHEGHMEIITIVPLILSSINLW